MNIHLVTYATPRFRHRQIVLGLSARWNGICKTVTHWTPGDLLAAGFDSTFPGISLAERGSGFWSWKPFVIQQTLRSVPTGDWVFYCDVGRRFPYKMLDRDLRPFVDWTLAGSQDFLPGLVVPWRGPMSAWTKRDAFVLTGMDQPEVHRLAPVQASFSLWRAGDRSMAFLEQWQDWCSRRELISDDPNTCGLPDLPDYIEHRHDQALLTLCCHRFACEGIDAGAEPLPCDTRNPAEVLARLFREPAVPATPRIRLLRAVAGLLGTVEAQLRKWISFGEPAKAHPFSD